MKRLITENYVSSIRDAIIRKKFNLNSTWQNGFSMLHFAVKQKKYQIVELLLDLGIDRTIMCNIEGQTALHLACINGFIPIIRLMISKGREDLELLDRYGKTPLNYTSEHGHKTVAKFLIENGASTTYLDQSVVNELVQTREDREFARRTHRLDQELYFERRILRRPETKSEVKTEVVLPNKDIIDLIIKNAIEKESICPISLELITAETAVLTNCFHVFSKESINSWLTRKETCPVCKTKCFVL